MGVSVKELGLVSDDELVVVNDVPGHVLRLASFFKKNSQNEFYTIDAPGYEIRAKVGQTGAELFKSFHIVPRDDSGIIAAEKSRYMLILDEEDLDDVENVIRQKRAEVDGNFTECVVLKNFDISSLEGFTEVMELAETINLTLGNPHHFVFHNSTLLNAFKKLNEQNELLANVTMDDNVYDITPHFRIFTHQMLSVNELSVLMLEIVEKIRAEARGKVLFYSGVYKKDNQYVSKEHRADWAGCAVAAYLCVTDGFRFTANTNRVLIYFNDFKARFRRRDYCYFDDYLHLIAHAPEVGVYVRDNAAYLAIRDSSLINKRGYGIRVKLISSSVDPVTGQLLKNGMKVDTFSYQNLELVPIRDFYDLKNPNWSIAWDNYIKFNAIVGSLYDYLMKEGFALNNISFNLNNIVLFRVKNDPINTLMLGYVAEYTVQYAYDFIPVCDSYESFTKTLDDKMIVQLQDIRDFDDWESYVQLLKQEGICRLGTVAPFIPEYRRGAILSGISIVKPSGVDETCGLTLEEVGVWSNSTHYLRSGIQKQLFEKLLPKKLWENGSLTFFGGPLSKSIPTILVNVDTWR